MKRNALRTAGDGKDETRNVMIEPPIGDMEVKHVNGKHADLESDDPVEEEDLVLGNEDELSGDEVEYEIELEEDEDTDADLDEDDLIIDVSDDVDDEEEDDDL